MSRVLPFRRFREGATIRQQAVAVPPLREDPPIVQLELIPSLEQDPATLQLMIHRSLVEEI